MRTRRLHDKITLLRPNKFNRHGLQDVICSHQVFDKPPFFQFYMSIEIRFVAVAENHHKDIAIVKRANCFSCEHVAGLDLAEPRISLVDLVATTFFHSFTSFGRRNISSFELPYNRT